MEAAYLQRGEFSNIRLRAQHDLVFSNFTGWRSLGFTMTELSTLFIKNLAQYNRLKKIVTFQNQTIQFGPFLHKR